MCKDLSFVFGCGRCAVHLVLRQGMCLTGRTMSGRRFGHRRKAVGCMPTAAKLLWTDHSATKLGGVKI